MSFPIMPPSPLGEFAVAPDGGTAPPPSAQDEAPILRVAGNATWVVPGSEHSPGHGRGELVVSRGAVSFELRSGERFFAHRGETVAFTHTPLAAVVVVQDGETRVRVTVSALSRHLLARALADAGVLA